MTSSKPVLFCANATRTLALARSSPMQPPLCVRRTRLKAFVPGLLRPIILAMTAVAVFQDAAARGASISVNPSRDNSIYAESNNSNATGSIYVGRTAGTNGTSVRRGLVQFDIASLLPAGATINSVSLKLERVIGGPNSTDDILELHALSAGWGEGTSFGVGQGAAPTAGDATWNFSLFNSSSWTNPGGDFGATSGSTILGSGSSTFTFFSQAGMVADVQNWLNSPASNFGWLLKYSDENTVGTARAFFSREASVASQRPTLTIDFTPAPEPGSLVMLGLGALLVSSRRRP